MKTRNLIFLMIFILFSGCATQGVKITKKECMDSSYDQLFVDGECIRFFKSEGNNKDKVIVFLHGSFSSSRGSEDVPNPIEFYGYWGEYISKKTGITTYVVSMPGYAGSSANKWFRMYQSSRKYNATDLDFIKFTTELLKYIKKIENKKELYVIGHSAGATLGATISGYEPNLIKNAILYEGIYDINNYYSISGLKFEYSSISAANYIRNITNTNFLVMQGMKSDKIFPEVSRSFVNVLKNRNLNVNYIEFPEFGHRMNNADIYQEIIKYINKG